MLIASPRRVAIMWGPFSVRTWVDDRVNQRATLITSQLPVTHWHEYLGEPTVADAVLDRLLQSAHRLELNGDSLRRHRDGRDTPKVDPS